MAGSINEVTLLGNLGDDPEIRTTQGGARVATFPLATNEAWTKDGEKKERTQWHRVVVFGEALIQKLIEPYVTKGKTVLVRGTLRTRKWIDKDNNDRWTTEVVVGSRNSYVHLVGGSSGRQETDTQDTTDTPPPAAELDDEVPA